LRLRADPNAVAGRKPDNALTDLASGERKFLTVMFADIVGSTTMVEKLDPEQSIAALDRILRIMFRATHTYGGTVNRVQGDGIVALFGAPIAHEDHAARACLAGLMIVEEMGRLPPPQAEARVGLHSGLVVVRTITNDMSVTYDAGGPTVHLAARMEQLCKPRTVRATAATFHLAAQAVVGDSLGVTEVRGFADPVESFLVRGAANESHPIQRRPVPGPAPFVGRAEHVATLQRAATLCRRGAGQAVLVHGPPGIGKSRLLEHLIATHLANDFLILRAACAPYHRNTSYYAVGELLLSWPRLDGESDTQRVVGLGTALAAENPALTDELAPLRALLSLPPDDTRWESLEPAARRRRIEEAILRLFSALALAQPLALLIEDLHWADVGTMRLVEQLAARCPQQRWLLLATSRDAHPALPEALKLDGLSNQEAEMLLTALLGADRSVSLLKQRILDATQGTPLFMQEMVNALVTAGDLVRGTDGYVARRRVQRLSIPPALTVLLTSRIDQLERPLKWVLQVAAVIGNRAPLAVLARVLGRPVVSVAAELETLCELGFIDYQRRATRAFSFRHTLMREAAYESLLHEQRIVLHGAVAEALEAQFGAGTDEKVESIAHHAVLGELWEKALVYTRQAADEALQQSAMHEAARFFELALSCLDHLPHNDALLAQAADVHLAFRMALWPTGHVAEANSHIDQAEHIAAQLGDDRRLGHISIARTQVLTSEGNLDDAVATGLRARAHAAIVGDEALSLRADFVLAQAYQFRGEFRRTIASLAPSRPRITEALRHERLLGNATTTSVQHLAVLSRAHCALGEFATGNALAHEAVLIAREVGRRFDLGFALQALGTAALWEGHAVEAKGHLEQALRICDEDGFDALYPLVAAPLGFAETLLGCAERGLTLLRQARGLADKTHLKYYGIWASSLLASAALLLGDVTLAGVVIREALPVACANSYLLLGVWLRRAFAVVMAAEAPEAALREIATARDQAVALGILPDVAFCDWTTALILVSTERAAEAVAWREAAIQVFDRLGMQPPPPSPIFATQLARI
jgi:class 3 adenylate cyclase/tetratricopeptide (TPR) repeat protein